jgi:hypothetical protein
MKSILVAGVFFALQVCTARADCAGGRQIDRCLVGPWQVSTDGVYRWTREHLHGFNPSISQEGNTLALRADGTFTTGQSRVDVTGVARAGGTGTGHVEGGASGRWSATAGRLNMCFDSTHMSGSTTVVVHGRTITVPSTPQAPPVSSRSYTCGTNTFTLTTPISGAGAVESTYTRMSAHP